MSSTNEKIVLKSMLNSREEEFRSVDAEIVALHTRREEIKEHIAALHTLLRNANNQPNKQTKTDPRAPFAPGIGFRDAVRQILRDSDSDGMNTRQIRENLIDRGYSYTAETPLPIRISNEMRRMVIQGIMVKRGKKYSLTKKGWNM